MSARQFAIRCLLLIWPVLVCAAADGPPPQQTEFVFHSVVPLGADGLRFRDARQTMYLLASATNPQFEGWRRVVEHGRRMVLDVNGAPVRFFPDTISFRVTASTELKLLDVQQWPATAGQDMNLYLAGLRFRLRIFHGLSMRVVQPENVEMIGVPADVAYNERIYRVAFHAGRIPMSDRIVLEVLSPQGQRISRFHLDFQ